MWTTGNRGAAPVAGVGSQFVQGISMLTTSLTTVGIAALWGL